MRGSPDGQPFACPLRGGAPHRHEGPRPCAQAQTQPVQPRGKLSPFRAQLPDNPTACPLLPARLPEPTVTPIDRHTRRRLSLTTHCFTPRTFHKAAAKSSGAILSYNVLHPLPFAAHSCSKPQLGRAGLPHHERFCRTKVAGSASGPTGSSPLHSSKTIWLTRRRSIRRQTPRAHLNHRMRRHPHLRHTHRRPHLPPRFCKQRKKGGRDPSARHTSHLGPSLKLTPGRIMHADTSHGEEQDDDAREEDEGADEGVEPGGVGVVVRQG